jgi:2-dehydropantoate 2-reductase
LARESAAVARAAGAVLDSDEIVARTLLVAKRTASNRPSMLQDLDRHRRTEIDAITGKIVRTAERLKLPVPLNEAVYALVRAREAALAGGSPAP